MELLVIFSSEEKGVEEILDILHENGVERGVAIKSEGMKKVLEYRLSAGGFLGRMDDTKPFNRTILAIIEKENVTKMINTINNYWKNDKDKESKKNRVMFSVPLANLTIGV